MDNAIDKRLIEVRVDQLRIGDKVDLASCPYLKTHATAAFEYAEVAYLKRETLECIVVGYEGIDHVGYPLGTKLEAVPRELPVVTLEGASCAGFSFDHLSRSDNQLLSEEVCPARVYKSAHEEEDSILVRIPMDISEGPIQQDYIDAGYSMGFIELMRIADQSGFLYMLFSDSGGEYPELRGAYPGSKTN